MADVTLVSTTDTEKDLIRALESPEDAPPEAPAEAPVGDEAPVAAAAAPAEEEAPEEAATAEPAAAAEAAEPAAEPPAAAKPPKRRSYQERIDELTREKHAERRAREEEANKRAWAEADRDRLAHELAEARAPSRRAEPPAPPVAGAPAAPVLGAKPKQEDFADYDAYMEAVAAWKATEASTASESRLRAEFARAQDADRINITAAVAARRRESVIEAHHARLVEARQDPQFVAELEAGQDLPVSPPMEDAILHSAHGPTLMRYLVTHPEECERIASLPPAPALFEMGRLEATLTPRTPAAAPGSAAPRMPVSRAPAPIQPVGAAPTATTKPPDEMTYQEYKAWEAARERARSRAR